MKRFKWMIFILLAGCRRDIEIDLNDNNILAGIVSKDMIYYDFEPDIILDTLPVSEPFGTEVNTLDVDINNDSISDLRLRAISYKSDFNYGMNSDLIRYNAQQTPFNINAAILYYNLDGPFFKSYNCFGIPKKLNFKEKVNLNSSIWTTHDSLYNGLPLRITILGLASRGTDNTDVFQKYGKDNWINTSNGYIGMRFIEGNDTLYGWIRLSVDGYSKIILHDCAYQKK